MGDTAVVARIATSHLSTIMLDATDTSDEAVPDFALSMTVPRWRSYPPDCLWTSANVVPACGGPWVSQSAAFSQLGLTRRT